MGRRGSHLPHRTPRERIWLDPKVARLRASLAAGTYRSRDPKKVEAVASALHHLIFPTRM